MNPALRVTLLLLAAVPFCAAQEEPIQDRLRGVEYRPPVCDNRKASNAPRLHHGDILEINS